MRVLGIIPARGGSKGVPRKNVRPLHGRPLLAYTADAARSASRLTHTVLSTDDEEVASVGRSLGLSVPFLRPAELARDDTPTFPVIMHALEAMEREHDRYDAVCLLQPTSPLRAEGEVDRAIEMLSARNADTVFSMLAVPSRYNPHWVYEQGADGRLHLSTGERAPITRRQALPPAYHRDGAVYVTRRTTLETTHSLYGDVVVGYLREESKSVDIDTLDDWARAESMAPLFAAHAHRASTEAGVR